MINNYLRELVQNNRRVIIPDFGAFLKKDKDTAKSDDFVTFSPFLRFNDGLLEGYLAEKKNITKEEASATVRRYVQEIKQTIAKQRPYYVDDLGAFYEDERGSVQFLYAETEKEALSKFEKAIAAARVSTPTFMPDMEVKTPAAVAAAVEPVVEKKKRVTRKKVVEVISEEDDDDVAEVEEVKTVSVRGRKKAETIINVNVTNNEKSKDEQRAEEKSKQLEAANDSLQRWIAAEAKRKEDEKKGLVSPPESADQKELEAKQHRQEEVENAVRKKIEDEKREREAAYTKPSEVWEEEVVGRRKGGRGAILLLAIIVLVLASAGAMWFWTPISEIFGFDEPDIIDYYDPIIETKPVTPPPAVSTSFVPAVSAQQPNMYYVVIGSFTQQQIKEMMTICQTLHNAGFTPEIVKTSSKFSISVGKYRTLNEAKVTLSRYSQKFGKNYGEVSIVP